LGFSLRLLLLLLVTILILYAPPFRYRPLSRLPFLPNTFFLCTSAVSCSSYSSHPPAPISPVTFPPPPSHGLEVVRFEAGPSCVCSVPCPSGTCNVL
jgi:hypothetical protein